MKIINRKERKEEKKLTFADVPNRCLFKDNLGRIIIKDKDGEYVTITNKNGDIYALILSPKDCKSENPIQEIYPDAFINLNKG